MSSPGVRKQPEHEPEGDPCARCDVPARLHRKRDRPQRERPSGPRHRVYLGIDGEGQGKAEHRYVLLAWSDPEQKRRSYIEDPKGLGTARCLDFILRMPKTAKVFAYAFGYDLTKILADLPDETLYLLFRPDLRRRFGEDEQRGPRPVSWGRYLLNLQGTKFVVYDAPSGKARRKRIIWDIVKFYQSKFVNALESWKVGSDELRARMSAMKAKRSDFDRESLDAVRAYCLEECAAMATLAERLVDAHADVGLPLRAFYGAGSTGGAMLKRMGVHKLKRATPPEMRQAVACSFFGGRFEHSVIGPVEREVWGYDISSAYPYQITFLPCLEHARWEKTRDRRRAERARAALVRYRLVRGRKDSETKAWGPFPFREVDGTIVFPGESPGGWVWNEEFFAGAELFSGVQFREAWVLETDCDCQPFAKVPEYYAARCKWGKEGRGIVLKLGCNSCYGKLAQSIGSAPFQSWIWAAMITSGTRAQILQAMGLLRRRDSLLAVATDGIYTRERLKMPAPLDTGTWGTGKPLGGWEEKHFPKGMFFMRPGVYWPLDAHSAEELKQIRGRGVGKAVMIESRELAMRAWREGKPSIEFPSVTRFHGAKSSIGRVIRVDAFTGEREWQYRRSKEYGQWSPFPIEISFAPMPKRLMIRGNRLVMRRILAKHESYPYDRAEHQHSPDAANLKALTVVAEEQPDGGAGDNMVQYEGDRA